MPRTGIFFTYFQGERLRDFPGALAGILNQENVFYYDAVYDIRDGLFYLEPLDEELLGRVHSPEMVGRIRQGRDYLSARYCAGATVQAAQEIRLGRLDNAFIFTGFGDHHAGRDFYGGGCYFNGAALAICALRQQGAKRFAIVDTDAHHADGTRDIFLNDSDVLHLCLCHHDYADSCNNRDVSIPGRTTDAAFLGRLREALDESLQAFRPEMIFWEYGYDATAGDYGDKGLSPDCHAEICGIIREAADRVCRGRLVAILCGGSSPQTATYTIPRIIRRLAD